MRKVYLDISGKMHSLYNELINYPPDGYEFLANSTFYDRKIRSISNINIIYDFQNTFLNNIAPMNLMTAYFGKYRKRPNEADLTYSSGHLVLRNEPWVVDLEYILHLSGYNYNHFKNYRRIIEKSLRSDNCKKIMPWTEAGKKTFFTTISDKEILNKVETVHLAVHKKNFTKLYNKRVIKLLFVGSANIPKDFHIKGGKEVLAAFKYLNKKYDNIELVLRTYVPKQIKDKLRNCKNIKIIDNILPWEDIEKEFTSADIFLFPSHNTPGMVILDAMSYELPVITTDVWANREMVNDGCNGFIISSSKKLNYFDKYYIPTWSSNESLEVINRYTDPTIVDELVEKTSILIENENLRRRMGKSGRSEVESGKFSIKKRNSTLKKIFDENI